MARKKAETDEAQEMKSMAQKTCADEIQEMENMAEETCPGAASEKPQAETKLESLWALAARHRVAGWQQAGLLRMMGWEDGKMVSEADYVQALEKLQKRRLGGGRLA